MYNKALEMRIGNYRGLQNNIKESTHQNYRYSCLLGSVQTCFKGLVNRVCTVYSVYVFNLDSEREIL